MKLAYLGRDAIRCHGIPGTNHLYRQIQRLYTHIHQQGVRARKPNEPWQAVGLQST